ncbi:MAG: DUF6587 family protein [Burkholderiales bacterium]
MQALIVYLAVAVAALQVAWRFMPAALRRRLAARIGASMRSRGVAAERVVRLEAKLNSGGSCGSCDSCNACDTGSGAVDGADARTIRVAMRPPAS